MRGQLIELLQLMGVLLFGFMTVALYGKLYPSDVVKTTCQGTSSFFLKFSNTTWISTDKVLIHIHL